ncbi:hypothetical protein EDC65_1344 [Stella humosa]|uniref:Lipoprotein n=1 Tax=Stella humosa TaxID=94 RepID=A0A3N1M1H8_9PROT|nr:hypothetical protein [Stella humosa]ROP99561.1 hypothetical protein EDC65_1344 [Stella humosa]BBK31218.1 hypothetical protein STHU_18520 [Stella humosa]
MIRLALAAALSLLVAACNTVYPTAGNVAAIDPECAQATPGNSLPGFRCTGDYTGDAQNTGRGR